MKSSWELLEVRRKPETPRLLRAASACSRMRGWLLLARLCRISRSPGSFMMASLHSSSVAKLRTAPTANLVMMGSSAPRASWMGTRESLMSRYCFLTSGTMNRLPIPSRAKMAESGSLPFKVTKSRWMAMGSLEIRILPFSSKQKFAMAMDAYLPQSILSSPVWLELCSASSSKRLINAGTIMLFSSSICLPLEFHDRTAMDRADSWRSLAFSGCRRTSAIFWMSN
mmetsp:Transcript_46341/g.145369  ORF Transcript_46341/g.145369 Transcript_46341/m.145369 type:complete len:226 (+) Transcript_46341:217-894(+)